MRHNPQNVDHFNQHGQGKREMIAEKSCGNEKGR